MKLLDDFVHYVSDLTGNAVYPEELSLEKRNSLPIFLSRSYSLHVANILGKDYLLLIHEHGDEPTPARAETYARVVWETLGDQAVFVFPKLDSFVRDRLTKRRLPFVVPYKHIFIPSGLIDSREQPSRGSLEENQSKIVSAPAQIMLFYHLLSINETEDWPLKKWAEALRYSRMTISRAWKELASNDLCFSQKRGRNLVLRFPESNREAWNKALPILLNAVRHRITATFKDTDTLPLRKSGLSALAERTLISAGGKSTYAMAMANWRAAVDQEVARRASWADESGVIVEAWRYDPELLSPEEDIVDALSLYLTLRDDPDERIQSSLEDMIERFPWQT